MHRHLDRLSSNLIRAGLMATLFMIGAALTPREAEASKVCAPDNRGCYWTRVKCPDIDLLSGWTCTRSLAVNPRTGDVLARESDGRAVALVNGQRIYILSDAVEAQLAQGRPDAESFARLVQTDRGSVSERSLQMVSEDLGLPIRPGGSGVASPSAAFDVGIRKRGPDGPLTVGQTATFTLSPFNTGPSAVDGGSGVVVTDTVPSNFTQPVTANGMGAGWTCAVAGLVVTCAYNGAAVGANQSLPGITITAVARREGGYENCANIAFRPRDGGPRGGGGAVTIRDANPRDNRDCIRGEVTAGDKDRYDVSIRKRGPEGPLSVGQTATFTLDPHNNGPSSVDQSTGVLVSDQIPGNFAAPVAANGGLDWNCTTAGLNVTCLYTGGPAGIGPLPTITITAVAKEEGRYENCAEITFRPRDFGPRGPAIPVGGPIRDANPRDNRDCIRGEVTPDDKKGYDVSIRKRGPEGPLSAGQTATFTLDPHNNGPSPVDQSTGVLVTDQILGNFGAPVTANGGLDWSCTIAGLNVTCLYTGGPAGIGPLPTITITAVAKDEGRYENCAEIGFRPRDFGPRGPAIPVGGPIRDVNPRDNRDCIQGEVTAGDKDRYDVSIRKRGPEGPLSVGQAATFTLDPHNNGPSSVDQSTGVQVHDEIPGNFGAPVTANGGPDWSCTVLGLAVTCNYTGGPAGIGPLPTITITAVAKEEGRWENCAEISLNRRNPVGPRGPASPVGGAIRDANPRDNRDCIRGEVTPDDEKDGYDVSIRKFGGGTVSVGGQVSFTLNPHNNGPGSVASVTVVDELPAGLTFITAPTGSPWDCSLAPPASGSGTQMLTCVYSGSSVGPGPFPVIDIQATAERDGEFTNCAEISLDGVTDASPQDNRDCRSYVVTPLPTGTITIIKDAQPNGPQSFSFTSSTPNIPGFTLPGTPPSQNVITGLPAGGYAFTEGYTEGWTLTDIVCTSASGAGLRRIFDRWGKVLSSQTVTVDLEPGDNVICTFTNTADEVPPPTPTGTLTIVKDVQPGGHAQDFTFTTVGAGLIPFSLDDDPSSAMPDSKTFTNLVPGPYTVTEVALSGWAVSGTGYQSSLNCGHVGPTASTFTPVGNSVTVNLVADDHVTCTFINTQVPAPAAPDLAITKVGAVTETAAGHLITYTIVITNPGGTTPSGTIHLVDLLSGFPAGTIYNSASGVGACSPGVPGTPWDCEVPASNLGLPITIEIVVPPGGGSVTNCATVVLEGDPNLQNNEVCVTNTIDTPINTVCDDSNSNTMDVVSADGICHFIELSPTGSITIKKDAQPNDAQDFEFLFVNNGSYTYLDDDDDGFRQDNHVFSGLAGGATYTFTETAVAGWSLAGIVCAPSNGTTIDVTNRTVAVNLASGAAVTCTFTNVVTPLDGTACDDGNTNTVNDAWVNGVCTGTPTGTGTITIVKNAVPDDSQGFFFLFGTGGGSFVLDDDGGATSNPYLHHATLTGLAAGPWAFTENVVPGWSLTGIVCTPSGGHTVDLANRKVIVGLTAGAHVTCTFTNVLTPPDGTACDDGNANTANDAWVNGVCTGTPTGAGTGTLTITKDVDPGSDPQDFHFTSVGPGLSDFSLDDDPSTAMPNSVTFTNLALGVPFTVTEDALSPWTVPSLQCYVAVPGLTTQTTDQLNRTFTVTLLDPGANVNCVFMNVR